jgi:hypothetical protein
VDVHALSILQEQRLAGEPVLVAARAGLEGEALRELEVREPLRITFPRSSISTSPPVECLPPIIIPPCSGIFIGGAESALYWNVARTFPFASRR